MPEREKGMELQAREHGGNIHKLLQDKKIQANTYVDFSANINPCGPPAWLRSHLNRELERLLHYPDPDCRELRRVIAGKYGVAEESVLPANGTTELLHLLPRILDGRKIIVPVPSYIDYTAVFRKNGFPVETVALAETDGFSLNPRLLETRLQGGEVVLFGNPANPAGSLLPDGEIIRLAAAYPDSLFIVDEAFHDFTTDFATVGNGAGNIITLNSLTKFFAVPGLRIGFGIFPPPYAEQMRAVIPQWSVNSLAQSTAVRALQDDSYCRTSRETCRRLREQLAGQLGEFPQLRIFASAANYLLGKLVNGQSAETLYHHLLSDGIIIRRCGNYEGLDASFFRVAVRTEPENRRLVAALGRFLTGRQAGGRRQPRTAASLMFQGTSSNAGKSILAAAFCRILLQDGLKVAPFKAQNMSLNSHVTRDGGEMGRAQVVQAMAARVDPDCRMNPVLLKPNSHTGSQVIVNGRPVGNMDVRQYHAFKETAWASVAGSYDYLAARHDVMILEGAGSPGEVNLKRHDFVNMRMARYAGSPVLLVGDIDRGGVYASFAGIMDVLEEWERRLISGFVVNKFRGDQGLLDEAHRFIRDHTGREVFAVVPFIEDLTVPQEDSVSLKEGFYGRAATADTQVEIGVLDLPHISNFTDIDPLHHEPDVNIRLVRSAADLGAPDAIILPGSKNVAGDLDYLERKGFLPLLRDHAARGCEIVGICGGYQMLGHTMQDPHRIETTHGSVDGLGLLEVETVLQPDKTLKRREGFHVASGLRVTGYEIHHGTTGGRLEPVLRFGNGESCGSRNEGGTVWGAYLHGIFDEDAFRRWFIDRLRVKKGLPASGRILMPYNLEKSLDDLAARVRACFDMNAVYRLLQL